MKTSHQKFEYREIPRAHIKNAPYNPRTINDYQRANLRKSLQDFGMVEPFVWNERTGNLVGGHQRLSIMDDLEGGSEYSVGVAVVKLGDKAERRLNVILNNRAAQGDFTAEGLRDLLSGGLALEEMMLTRVDLEAEFGNAPELDEVLAGLEEAKQAKREAKPAAPAPKLNKNEIRKAAADNPENDAGYTLLLVFDCGADKMAWLKRKGKPMDAPYVHIREVDDNARAAA